MGTGESCAAIYASLWYFFEKKKKQEKKQIKSNWNRVFIIILHNKVPK